MERAKKLWNFDDVVCVHKLKLEGEADWKDFTRGAYELLKAMFPCPAGKVLIKPNVVLGFKPESGIVTHPAFVGGIVDYLKEIGLSSEDIAIAEGGGVEGNCDMARIFSEAGYTKMAREKSIELISLNADENVRVAVPDGRIFSEIGIARSVRASGRYLINVPKLKTHNLAVTTLSMKNLQGTITPLEERHLCALIPEDFSKEDLPRRITPTVPTHPSMLSEAERKKWYRIGESGLTVWEEIWREKICDLASVVRPDLNIVEGIVGRDGTGFRRGNNYPTGLVVAGINPVAVDSVAGYLIGFDPKKIGYLVRASERGLGTNDIGNIKVHELQDGELVPSTDLEGLVWSPPFRAIRGWEKEIEEENFSVTVTAGRG